MRAEDVWVEINGMIFFLNDSTLDRYAPCRFADEFRGFTCGFNDFWYNLWLCDEAKPAMKNGVLPRSQFTRYLLDQ